MQSAQLLTMEIALTWQHLPTTIGTLMPGCERAFNRAIGELESLFQFTEECLAERGLGEDVLSAIDLVLEEFFTNMVKYSPDGSEKIVILIDIQPRQLIVTMTETDVERFDVTNTQQVDFSKPLAERRRGGLGIHLAKELMDSLSYDYHDRTSRIRFSKNLE